MTVQNEVRWILQTVKTNWPTATFPSDLARVDRDEPEVLETGERTKAVELSNWNAVSASLGQRTKQFIGKKPFYRVITTVGVRVKAAHSSDHGNVDSNDEFLALVRRIQYAIDQNISYPTVDTGTDDIGRVSYRDSAIVNENGTSNENVDSYRYDFDVRLRGHLDPTKQ